jgi:hypothetical protein
MSIIKNTKNNKYWQGCEGKRTLIHRWWECKLVQPLWEQYGGSSKTKNRTAIRSSNSTPSKGTSTPMFIAALFTIPNCGKSQEQLMSGLRKCGLYIQWNFIQP